MPKDFLQGASLTPTFEALMVKFGGKIGTLYQMLKNAFKKHPLQNRTNVQIKGGGGQRPFEQCSKKLHFFERGASLICVYITYIYNVQRSTHMVKKGPDCVVLCRLLVKNGLNLTKSTRVCSFVFILHTEKHAYG